MKGKKKGEGAAGYLRTSTKKQDLDGQRRAVNEWAEREGLSVRLFEDNATSGRKAERAGIEAMLAAAERGEFRQLAVVELSRLGRSLGFIHTTVDRLTKAGVRIVLVKTGTILDTTTLEGRATIGALALASDIEWHLIQERNARGRETIRLRGVKVGRKPREISETVLRTLREKGMSVRQIARELGVPPSVVGRAVKRLEGGDKGQRPGSAP